MIIQIRGTSGSGKTYVMRKAMQELSATGLCTEWGKEAWEPVYTEGRKKPLYYKRRNQPWFVLGHYEATCGGCDNIGSARAVYDLVKALHPMNIVDYEPIILCEGLLLSEDTKWSLQMPDLRVLFLATPLESCLTNVAARRRAAGNDKPLNPKNTENRVRVIERARIKLVAAGVECRRATSNQAPRIILDWMLGAAWKESLENGGGKASIERRR